MNPSHLLPSLPSPRTLAAALLLPALVGCPGGEGADAPDDTDTPTDTDTPSEGPAAIPGVPATFRPHAIAAMDEGWVVAGEADGDVAVLRLGADLRPLPGFGTDGLLIADLGGPTDGFFPQNTDALFDVSVTAEHLLFTGAGWGFVLAQEGQWFVLRTDHDGVLDPAFGEDGIVRTDWGAPAAAQRVVPTGDGGVVVWGKVTNPGGSDHAGVRYLADGTVDGTFADSEGSTGVIEPQSGDDSGEVVFPDRAGWTVGGGTFTLYRYGLDGRPDLSYGESGVLELTTGWLNLGISVGDGHLLAGAGPVPTDDGGERSALRLVRLGSDGLPDPTFGEGGVVSVSSPVDVLDFLGLDLDAVVVRVRGLATRPDGGILAYVQLSGLTNQVPALMLLDASGAPVPTFGEGGTLVLPGALPLLEGASTPHSRLLTLDGDDALIVDTWLYDAAGGGIESRPVALRVPLP